MLANGFIEQTSSDIVIVHGCAVTERAAKKGLQFVRSIERENPDAEIILAGCLAKNQQSPQHKVLMPNDSLENLGFSLKKSAEPMSSLSRPLVKIQDGCEQFCTYCIVPHLRGHERSFSVKQIIDEINYYVESGFWEIVLTGIHIGRYNFEGQNFSDLISTILANTDVKRLRLSSIEPPELTETLLEIISHSERIARYIHLPLQSGSDKILEKMGRPYKAELFSKLTSRLVQNIPDIGIGTDVIVGFPEETDENFQETIDVLQNSPVYNIHPFKFSPRQGTPAYKMPQIPAKVKSDRMKQLLKLRTQKRNEFLTKYIGKSQKYLIENISFGVAHGTSSNYIRCQSKNPDAVKGEEISLTGTKIEKEGLDCQ